MSFKYRLPVWLTVRSLTGRLLLISSVWLFFALSLGGYVISDAFHNHVKNEFDFRLLYTLDSLIGASNYKSGNNFVLTRKLSDQRFDRPYSGWYWQVRGPNNILVRSRSLWDQKLELMITQPVFNPQVIEMKGPESRNIRVVFRDANLPGSKETFRFIVAGDTRELQTHLRQFDRLIAGSLSALGLSIIIALILQVAIGLSPLRGIRKSLAAIRDGHIDKLPYNYPLEILPLVEDLNALIRHNDILVERARTQMGNLAHALKTPLTIIKNEITALKATSASQIVENQISLIQRQIDYQLARARASGAARHSKMRTPVDESLQAVLRTLRRLYKEKIIDFEIAIPSGTFFLGERPDLEEILGNLLENAFKWCKNLVRVSVTGKAKDKIVLCIEDNGKGVQSRELDKLFRRGERLDETIPGTGLGLAIVHDLVSTYGGEASAGCSTLGGLLIRVTLPGGISL